jgi:hypothetical protein
MLRNSALAGAALVTALVAFALYTPTDSGTSATVALRETQAGGAHRHVDATIQLHPRDAADQADWLTVTAWQGGEDLVVDRLEHVGPGRYRTTEPIPVYGNWKALLRLHEGRSLAALPLFLPADEAIPVGEVPATHRFIRAFGDEHELLQREQKGGSPLLVALAYSTVAAIALSLLALLAWGLHRLSFGTRSEAGLGQVRSDRPTAAHLSRSGVS